MKQFAESGFKNGRKDFFGKRGINFYVSVLNCRHEMRHFNIYKIVVVLQ